MIRDMERLKSLVESSDSDAGPDDRIDDAIVKIDCLNRALEEIPDYYRKGIIESVKVRGGGFDEFAHANTWKKWKTRFMQAFAANLGLYWTIVLKGILEMILSICILLLAQKRMWKRATHNQLFRYTPAFVEQLRGYISIFE